MTNKEQIEKLAKIISDVRAEVLLNNGEELYSHEIAKALVEDKKVVVLPCKVGDILWRIDWFCPEMPIDEVVVDSIEFMRNDYVRIRVHAVYQQYGTCFCADAIGEDFFTSKEAAEKALKEFWK